jgi:TrmH family RNA methyltransferase
LRLRKHRAATGRLLAEGPPAVREARRAGRVEQLLATAAAARRHPDLTAAGWRELPEAVMAELADTVHPSGLLAVCRWAPADLAAVLGSTAGPRLVAVAAAVRDPGNAGTVIRCADAFGADAAVLAGESVDPANPKTVRASAGSLFHLPVAAEADLAGLLVQLRAAGLVVLAADGAGSDDLADLAADGALAGPTAWVFGNEAWGWPEAAALADRVVRVPMWGQAESLNLAAAAAVCLYTTAAAQRRPLA